MYKITTLNKIAAVGLNHLPKERYEITADSISPGTDGILLRSFNMHEMELPEHLAAIARAGAGINNIPVEACTERGIVVFNTPGANANAVKELVLAGLLLASRRIVDGINWVQSLQGAQGVAKLVEKEKSRFGGVELAGKKLGVVGLGAIGVSVANAAQALGMQVYGFDPFMSVDAAWRLSRSIHKAGGLDEIFTNCEYISIHVPLAASTRHVLNKAAFSAMKPGVRLLNFSRAELVDDAALKAAMDQGIVDKYVTDFPSEGLLGNPNIITIPHLGASTAESEDNCAEMAAVQMKDYLEHGNIVNSVNFPECVLPYTGRKRVCVLHKNIPNVIGPLTTAFAKRNINIHGTVNISRGDVAYSIIEIDGDGQGAREDLQQVEGIIRIRFLKGDNKTWQ